MDDQTSSFVESQVEQEISALKLEYVENIWKICQRKDKFWGLCQAATTKKIV